LAAVALLYGTERGSAGSYPEAGIKDSLGI
jgi:hypothetical protein